MTYFLGIDIGTSSAKAMLMAPDGTIVNMAQRTYNVLYPHPEWAELPVDEVWEATRQILQQLSANRTAMEQIAAISFSGQMHSLVLLDEKGKPLRNAITWLDTRSKKEAEELEQLSRQKGYDKELLDTVTASVAISFLRWLQIHEPEVLKRTSKAMLMKDYIRYRICGMIGTDHSDAAGTIAYDQVNHHWKWDLLREIGIDLSIFSEKICNAHETAGHVTAACAAETGLKEGTLVCYGGGDTLMNHIGNGLIRKDGSILSTIGTSSHVSTYLDTPLSDPQGRAFTYCHALPNRWAMLAGGPNGGIVMKWLRDNILGKTLSFEELSKIGALAPAGSNNVRCIPYIGGSTCPNNPTAKSVYVGMGLSHGQPELIRSTMEGIIYILWYSLDILRSLNIQVSSIIATGGGSKDPLLLRIQADMYDLPVRLNAGKEISCMGAAISASVGSGYYSTYEEACSAIVKFKPDIIEPDPGNAAIYREILPEFTAIYESNLPYFH